MFYGLFLDRNLTTTQNATLVFIKVIGRIAPADFLYIDLLRRKLDDLLLALVLGLFLCQRGVNFSLMFEMRRPQLLPAQNRWFSNTEKPSENITINWHITRDIL